MTKYNTSDLIGKTFGKFNQLEVLEFHGYRRGKRDQIYLVLCHKCKEDSELFGDGKFLINKTHLTRGGNPCGCSNTIYWTKEQYEIKINRLCDSRFKFLGWVNGYINNRSKITVRCSKSGHIWNPTVASFLIGNGCLKCANEAAAIRSTKPDDVMIDNFMSTGKFIPGTIFRRTTRKDYLGRPSYWEYYCPNCSNDEYVINNICSGWFEATHGNLSSGKLSCRCNSNFQWTQAQYEYRIIKELENEDKLSFIGWRGDYAIDKRIHLFCDEHDDWYPKLHTFLNSNSRCPSCASTGFNPAKAGYLYVLEIRGRTGDFTGYGITGNIESRLNIHKFALIKYGYKIVNFRIFTGSGNSIRTVEKEIKTKFPVYRQEITGFRTEATYHDQYYNVINFVDKFLEQGDNV